MAVLDNHESARMDHPTTHWSALSSILSYANSMQKPRCPAAPPHRDVLAEGVRQVLGQALHGLGAGHQRLGGEANEGNLRAARHHQV